MTYHELKTRLTQVETALKSLQANTNKSLPSAYVKETVRTLTTIKESLEEKINLLAEAEDGTIYTDDEQKALKLADKGANVQLTKENEGVEFSLEETKAIAKSVGKGLLKALKQAGDEVARIKAHRIEENSFDIHVVYKGEGGEDEFSFYIDQDALHLVDFSFDKELVDVGVKPSGEAIVNVDVLANELLKHFKSLNEQLKEGEGDDHHYIKVPRRDYKKAMAILNRNVEPSYVKMDTVDDDGMGNVVIYFMFNEFRDDFDVEEREAFMYDAVMDLQAQGIDIADHSAELDEAIDRNDPVLMKLRATKMKADQPKKSINPDYAAVKNAKKIAFLKKEREQLMRDMEQEAEPEGGPIADRYGAKLNRIDNAIAKLSGIKNMSYDLAVGKVNEKVVKIADGQYDVKKTTFKFLERVSKRGLEGIVFYGTGGDLNDWVNGINQMWNDQKIGAGLIEDKMMGLYTVETTGGRTDLVMIFKTDSQMQIGKLAMWKLRFGDCSWLSDYVVNYADQHDLQEAQLKEDWGSSDQAAMNQSIHRDLGSPTKMPSPFDPRLESAVQNAVDFYWDDWPEYQRDPEELYTHAKRMYLRSMFRDTFNAMVRMFEPANESINEGTELYEKHGFYFKRFYGGKENGPSLQITTDKGEYITIPGAKLGVFMDGLTRAVRVFDDMSRQTPVDEASVAKIQKAHSQVVAKMKELAKQYKAGDKSVVSQLKDLTAKKRDLEKQLDVKVAGIGKNQELNELSGDQQEALFELQNILDQASGLGEEAREIIRQTFPRMLSKADAYGAFDFGSSSNRYDTTLESIIEEIEEYYDEEEDDMEEGKYKSDAQRKAIYATKAEKGKLKEYTDKSFSGAELINMVSKDAPDMFGKQLFTDLLPKGVASEDEAVKALHAHDKSPIKARMGQYAPIFVHVQYHELEHEGETYRLHQKQYYNSKFKDRDPDFNPRVTKITLIKVNDADRFTKNTEGLGSILVKTDAYVQDLTDLENQGKLGNRVS